MGRFIVISGRSSLCVMPDQWPQPEPDDDGKGDDGNGTGNGNDDLDPFDDVRDIVDSFFRLEYWRCSCCCPALLPLPECAPHFWFGILFAVLCNPAASRTAGIAQRKRVWIEGT